MKKTVSIFITTVAVSLCMLASVFADTSGHWAENTINSWVQQGLINGYEDGSFRPNANITRAEFATLVNKAFGYTSEGFIDFEDVPLEAWYYGQVACGVEAGYITGFEGNLFKPNDYITREQVAVVITKILNLNENQSAADVFSDANSLNWSKGFVGAAAKAGILKGYEEDGSFKPANNMTRAESVVGMEATKKAKESGAGNVTTPPTTGTPADQQNPDKDTSKDKTVAGSVDVTTASYGPSSGIDTVTGNVDISYTGNVTIKNIAVEKNLYINKGAANVTLENVHVEGGIYITGGSTITLDESDANEMEIYANKKVEIVSKGRSMIDKVVVKSEATLTENSANSRGFVNVELTDHISSSADIGLAGDFNKVTNKAKKININLTKGSIGILTIEKEATDTAVKATKSTTITNAYIYAEGSSIKGDGIVKSATVDAAKVTLQRKPDSINGKSTPTYIDSDKEFEYTFNILNGVGAPVSGAYVYVDDKSTATEVSSSTGKVVLKLRSGEYKIKIEHGNFDKYETKINISNTGSKSVNLQYISSRLVTYKFSVRDSSGNDVPDATVSLSKASSKTTNSSGNVEFTSLESGVYDYTVSKSGYSSNATGTIIANNSGTETVTLSGSEIKDDYVYIMVNVELEGDSQLAFNKEEFIMKVGNISLSEGLNRKELTIGQNYSFTVDKPIAIDGYAINIVSTLEGDSLTAVKNTPSKPITVTVTITINAETDPDNGTR